MAENEKTEAPAESGDVLLQYSGGEHVREVRRADLGVYPDSEQVLTWDTSNNFICRTKLTEEEVQVLARSGGSWAVVTEESSAASEEEEPKIELPTVTVERSTESASDQAQP
jgi:hypothetical protein